MNFLQHIKKATAQVLSVKSIGHANLESSEEPTLGSQLKKTS